MERWLFAAPVYALAYVAGAAIFWWMAKRRGMANQLTLRVMAAGLVGGLACANLVQLLAVGTPGKTIEGGIIGGWLAVEFAKRQLGVKRSTGDLFALAIPLGETIGRVACFIGGCCYGKVATGLAWAVYDHDAWRHPTQLYLSFGSLCCFAILYFAERKKLLPENSLFAMGGMLFCIDRFIVEFFRDGAAMVGSITLAQLGCCVGFAVFASMFALKAAAWNRKTNLLPQ